MPPERGKTKTACPQCAKSTQACGDLLVSPAGWRETRPPLLGTAVVKRRSRSRGVKTAAARGFQHPLGGEEESPRSAGSVQQRVRGPSLGVERGSQTTTVPSAPSAPRWCDLRAASKPRHSQHSVWPVIHNLQLPSLQRNRPVQSGTYIK